MHHIITGMLYLHSHGILHRDLTLSNLLLTSDMNIKIADFGLATQLKMPHEKHFTMCGTPNYIAPEIATHSAHGLESDVWSLGCMFYTFLVGKPPFDTDTVKNTLNKVMLADYKMPTFISGEAQDLIYQLLRKNPEDRITLSSVLDHSFMLKCSSSRSKSSETVEDSMDSGHATISTGYTIGTGSSGASTMGRLHLKTKVIGQFLPNKMAVITSHNRLNSSMEGSAVFSDRSIQNSEIISSNRGRIIQIAEEERPHSRWLRRAHSTDRSGTSQSQNTEKSSSTLERCHSADALTISGRPGMYNPANAHEDGYLGHQQLSKDSSGIGGSHEKPATSPPVKQTAKPKVAHEPVSDGPFLEQLSQIGMAHRWCEDGQACNVPFKTVVDVSASSTSENFYCGRKQHIMKEVVSARAWGKDPSNQVKSDTFYQESWFKTQMGIRKCDEVLLPHCAKGGNGQADVSYNCCQVLKPHSFIQQRQPSENRSRMLQELVSPLRAHRLKPIRQKTKNAVVSILGSEEVCMELLKGSSDQERVKEVLRISSDGSTIHIYHPNEGKGFPLDDRPPSPPEDVFAYSFDNLPEKYWKKYQYASKFVHLVRSKTPKVTLYTKYAKCMLMENSPQADVEVCFYDGAKINKTSEFLRIIDKSGKSHTLKGTKINGPGEELNSYVEHAHKAHQTCLELESIIAIQDERKEKPVSFFPIIIGRRPSSADPMLSPAPSVGPKSAAVEQPQIQHIFSSHTTSIAPSICSCESSNLTTTSEKNKSAPSTQTVVSPSPGQVLKSVFVPNVGWASQLISGEVWVQFNDGSQLLVQAGVASVVYTSPQGQAVRYGQNEKIPDHVKGKLQCLSSILGLLANQTNQHIIQ
ncbi:serine/threonine-protein kinase PLK4 isoform X2 [Stegostoma tigrinum]|nr:serine/threonine-protein kinase PLK4 isoform X2 [Stegostoma tigrinum]